MKDTALQKPLMRESPARGERGNLGRSRAARVFMDHATRVSFAVGVLVTSADIRPTFAQEAIAVISNAANGITDVTVAELRDLYLGRRTMFSNGARVLLAETRGWSSGFYRVVTGMREDQVRRHWIGLVFAGENATPPRELNDAESVMQYVATRPGAVGFVPANEAARPPSGAVVLRIGGRLPADAGYAIR